MKNWEEFLEGLTPRVFRFAALTLETIERRKLSLDSSFKVVASSFQLKSGEAKNAYKLAALSLRTVGVAKWLLESSGLRSLPLRRRAAFYIAAALSLRAPEASGKLASIRGGLLSNRLLKLLERDLAEEVSRVSEGLSPSRRISLKHSLPPLLAERLVSLLGEKEAEKLAQSLDRRTVWIRATTPGSYGELEAYLRSIGVRFSQDRELSYVYRLEVQEDEPLPEVPASIGVYQDKARVLVVEALARALDGALILDAAAAPCLKTQLLSSKLASSTIVAVDVSSSRIAACRNLLSSSGAQIDLVQADSSSLTLSREVDAALVDAPCTNSGAIGKDPGFRLALWDLSLEKLYEFRQRQRRILSRVLEILRRRGVVVYSTCSLFPEEGEDVIASFIDRVVLSPPIASLSPGYLSYDFARYVGRTFPHVHRTEGFFIALLRKAR
ncbi:MAG: RsmB/NOP family class I SAM-dependent RNA methyltransferase [Thermofilum sp.]